MSLEDPFFVVKDEVLKALLKTRSLYERWRLAEDGHEVRSLEEQEWSATELRNSIRSIEWDLEDLEDTVQIVEKNPAKFRLDPAELSVRKSFIAQTREEVKRMKQTTNRRAKNPLTDESMLDQVSLVSPSGVGVGVNVGDAETPASPEAPSKPGLGGGTTQYTRLPNALASPSPHRHGLRLDDDDEDDDDDDDIDRSPSCRRLHIISESGSSGAVSAGGGQGLAGVSRNAHLGHAHPTDLDERAVMLDEFGTEIENAESKLDASMRKMSKVLNMSKDRKQWMAVGVLSSTMIVILLLIFAL